MAEDWAKAAQEKYDRWVCLNGTAAQRKHVGTKNGSTVRCENVKSDDNSGDDIYYPRMEEVPAPDLHLPSRANQKKNLFNTAFSPVNRKIFVLLIAGFLLFLAVTNYSD
jgi:hypothetical protein